MPTECSVELPLLVLAAAAAAGCGGTVDVDDDDDGVALRPDCRRCCDGAATDFVGGTEGCNDG